MPDSPRMRTGPSLESAAATSWRMAPMLGGARSCSSVGVRRLSTKRLSHFAQQLAIRASAVVLLEQRTEQGGRGHEELDPTLVHGEVRIAEVHVEDAARLRSPAAQGRRQSGDDPQHREARAGRLGRGGIPEHALVALERAPYDRAAHLLALFRRERALVPARVDDPHAPSGPEPGPRASGRDPPPSGWRRRSFLDRRPGGRRRCRGTRRRPSPSRGRRTRDRRAGACGATCSRG